MKNKEKYEKQILTFACKSESFGVDEETREIEECIHIKCTKCKFYVPGKTCEEHRREWAESEYIEKPVISKKDRAFLEYLRDNFKTIARDENGTICVFTGISKKSEVRSAFVYDGFYRNISNLFYVDLPMVKWEDDEPWLIEDLKKLEVVEDYE